MKANQDHILDVRLIEPRLKHPTIFLQFDALALGDSLTILNDHDPKPLYYQLLNERGDIFDWVYVENGPVKWVVKIALKDGSNDETVGSIAANDWRKAQVFKKFGIDFCCGGKKSLREVCTDKKLDYAAIQAELQRVISTSTDRALSYNDWTASFLVDYILNTHHAYVNKALPELRAYAYKVATVHGEFHPELKRIYELVEALYEELTSHMMKEENILFPYIKELSSSAEHQPPHFGTVKNPIHVMEHEHDQAGEILREIRALSNDYLLPADACASYSLLFKLLEEFESDLHTHIHLENNILFPKALELENQAIA
jgi:regulator of cell morphogenesis and NO signaling